MRCYRSQTRIAKNNLFKAAGRGVAVKSRLNIAFEQFPDFWQLHKQMLGYLFGHNRAAFAIAFFESALMAERSFYLLGKSALNLQNNIADDITDVCAGYVFCSCITGKNNLSEQFEDVENFIAQGQIFCVDEIYACVAVVSVHDIFYNFVYIAIFHFIALY
jgi:hypothetical protein